MLLGVFFGQRARKKEKMNSIKTLCISFVGALVAIVIAITAVNNGWVALRSTNDLARLMDQNFQLSKELNMSRSEVENLKNSLSANIRFKTDAEGQVAELRKQLEQVKTDLRKTSDTLIGTEKVLQMEKNFGKSKAKNLQDGWDKALLYIAGALDKPDDRKQVEWNVVGLLMMQNNVTPKSIEIAKQDFDQHMDLIEKRTASDGQYYYFGNLGDVALPELHYLAIGYKAGLLASDEFMSRFNRMREYVRPNDEKSMASLSRITFTAAIR